MPIPAFRIISRFTAVLALLRRPCLAYALQLCTCQRAEPQTLSRINIAKPAARQITYMIQVEVEQGLGLQIPYSQAGQAPAPAGDLLL